MSESPLSLSEWLARHGGTVCLVFSDIVDSTKMLYANKTQGYMPVLRAYRKRARLLVGQQGGRLIEESGDELFVAFPHAAEGYAFGWELIHDPGHATLQIRVGVHLGVVSEEGGFLVGRDVHLAARVMQHSDGSQLWVSDAAKRALEVESSSATDAISWMASEVSELKGIPDKQRLWRAA